MGEEAYENISNDVEVNNVVRRVKRFKQHLLNEPENNRSSCAGRTAGMTEITYAVGSISKTDWQTAYRPIRTERFRVEKSPGAGRAINATIWLRYYGDPQKFRPANRVFYSFFTTPNRKLGMEWVILPGYRQIFYLISFPAQIRVRALVPLQFYFFLFGSLYFYYADLYGGGIILYFTKIALK